MSSDSYGISLPWLRFYYITRPSCLQAHSLCAHHLFFTIIFILCESYIISEVRFRNRPVCLYGKTIYDLTGREWQARKTDKTLAIYSFLYFVTRGKLLRAYKKSVFQLLIRPSALSQASSDGCDMCFQETD